jgi:hypothetical protein
MLIGAGMVKRLRNEDFPSPKRITDKDWGAICKTSGIPSEDGQRLKKRLDGLVDEFATWMRGERTQPDRKSDREQVIDILSDINAAAAQIDKLGPAGHLAFKAISPFVASMLSAQWMNESFPDDGDTPKRSSVPVESSDSRQRPSHRPSIRAGTYFEDSLFIEEHSLETRLQFVRQKPVKTMGAALKMITEGLSQVVRAFDLQPRSRGGQEPLRYRHYALINLIGMWSELGKEPSSGPNSDCTAFCESIAVAMGWPSEGLSSAMPDAMKDWRHFTGKNNR